jgi:NAD(P)H dehydrogenase (quinone)
MHVSYVAGRLPVHSNILKMCRMHLIVLGHPSPHSYSDALAGAYQRGLREGGAHVEQLALRDLVFDPILRHGLSGAQALEPDLVHAQRELVRARHVAWFFPTWWGAPPALVRGFVDRVFLPGFAYRHRGDGNGLPDGLLKGRSSHVVTTMDSPGFWYWLYHRGSLHGSFVNATLRYVGLGPIRTTTLYGLRSLTTSARERWLTKLEKKGREDAAKVLALSS